jgi:hypothetical protein
MFMDRVSDELLGQLSRFARSQHPTDDITAKNIHDDVELVMPNAA